MSNNNTDEFDYKIDDLISVKYDFNSTTLPNTSAGIYTTVGANGTTGSPYIISTGSSYNWNTTPVHIGGSGKIECTGEGADVVLNGKSVRATLEAIEERLAILQPNPELEKEWEELKELGQRYRTLEAEIKEKMKVWNTLKNTDL